MVFYVKSVLKKFLSQDYKMGKTLFLIGAVILCWGLALMCFDEVRRTWLSNVKLAMGFASVLFFLIGLFFLIVLIIR